MRPVKRHHDSFTERLELLLRLFSPWREKSLTYSELAEKMGGEWSESAVKSWAKRGEFSAAGRERLAELAIEEGLVGVTSTWLRDGGGEPPHKPESGRQRQDGAASQRSATIREPVKHPTSAATMEQPISDGRGYKLERAFVPASVLAVLERMPEDMQRAAIAAAFARGLDHQELHGTGLMRAAMGVCRELRRLGFVGVAKEIESEMMQAVFAEIENQHPPEPPKLSSR